MKREKTIQVCVPEDIEHLPEAEKKKWEVAVELGYFDKIVQAGWEGLTARESGKIGGILSARKSKKSVDNR